MTRDTAFSCSLEADRKREKKIKHNMFLFILRFFCVLKLPWGYIILLFILCNVIVIWDNLLKQ